MSIIIYVKTNIISSKNISAKIIIHFILFAMIHAPPVIFTTFYFPPLEFISNSLYS